MVFEINFTQSKLWCRGIPQKVLWTFYINFDIKEKVKNSAIEFVFKSHELFQKYQVTNPSNSTGKAANMMDKIAGNSAGAFAIFLVLQSQ